MGIFSFDSHHQPSHPLQVPLTAKEMAIWRLAYAYGFSHQGTAKLILGLRPRQAEVVRSGE